MKKGGEISESDLNLKQTAQDLIDMWTEEMSKFNSTYKVSEVAEKNKSTNKLDRHLVLVVNKKSKQKTYHTLPLDYWNEGETLRQVHIHY